MSPYWALTSNLNAARSGHSATLLQNGKVLVVGGSNDQAPHVVGSAELYDPATGTWTTTNGPKVPRDSYHTATLLPNGTVLVVGGLTLGGGADAAELYDPATGTWRFTMLSPLMPTGAHTATLLPNGRVLLAGGIWLEDRAELYDPVTETWSLTGKLHESRFFATATLLSDGRVLVAGGFGDAPEPVSEVSPGLSSAELYDPVTGTFSTTANLLAAAGGRTATLLPSGKVLVAGGADRAFGGAIPVFLADSQLYDPMTGQWSSTGNLNQARAYHTATLLPSGQPVLVAGRTTGRILGSAELYDEATGTWSYTASLNNPRSGHTATLLPDGAVLVAGGFAAQTLSSAELYTVAAPPANNSYRMTALFSDQAGFYQYIQLSNFGGSAPNQFAGFTLTVTSRSGVVKQFTFPKDPETSTQPLCIATANVWPTPSDLDYVIPNGFLPTDGGTINFAGVDSWTFGPFAASGSSYLDRHGSVYTSGVMECSKFSAALAVPIDPVIEYYSAALDHYFMSASQPDLDALDSGRIPGWTRTGYGFSAWITRAFDPLGGFSAPPNLADVCRLYIPPVDGDSHFFSASAAECAAAQARFPELVLETPSAFLATLPDLNTGVCPAGQFAVYRVWNGRTDSNHRYTTSLDVRNQMLARGFFAEGYGPDAVAMCVARNT